MLVNDADKEKQREYNRRSHLKHREKRNAYSRQYAAKDPEAVKRRNAEYYAKNREKERARAAAYRAANPAQGREADKRRYAENRTRELERGRAYRKGNPDKIAELAARRRAAKAQATPPWADRAAVLRVYKKAADLTRRHGIPFHVDHIVPLKHPLVCGLHWEANLHVLPGSVNVAKSNAFVPYEV